MPIVDMKNMLQHAYQHNYAVGAFEVVSLDFLQAIMQAAEEARAPVILSLAESHFDFYDFDLLMPAVETAARRALVPVALHFDHGRSLESATGAINRGCNGVLVDQSHLDFPENTAMTKQVVELGRSCGVAVEGELGYVPAIEGEGAEQHFPGELAYTSLAEAKAYVERTGVDFLAISIGTVHGHMKGKPRLDYQRLKQINEALQIPLVVHGGSGLSDDQCRRLIANGISKINYYTALSDIAGKQVKDNARDTKGYAHVQKHVVRAVASEVERCMRLWGAAGRAAEVLTRCRPCAMVEHLLACNVEGDQPLTESMMAEGGRLLATIPGVRDVFTGQSVDSDAQYQYTCLLRLCHPQVIDSLHLHPSYTAFTNKLFNAMTGKCISIDFQTFDPPVPFSRVEQASLRKASN